MTQDQATQVILQKKNCLFRHTHQMLFNTGVRPYNRLNSKGEFHLGEWEVIENGTIHVVYFLSEPPKDGYKLLWLQPDFTFHPEELHVNYVAIKIVGGGMLSDWAIFQDMNYKAEINADFNNP